MKNKLRILSSLLMFMATIPINTFAAWQGPQEILSGTWGQVAGQFYFGAGESNDISPKYLVLIKMVSL